MLLCGSLAMSSTNATIFSQHVRFNFFILLLLSKSAAVLGCAVGSDNVVEREPARSLGNARSGDAVSFRRTPSNPRPFGGGGEIQCKYDQRFPLRSSIQTHLPCMSHETILNRPSRVQSSIVSPASVRVRALVIVQAPLV